MSEPRFEMERANHSLQCVLKHTKLMKTKQNNYASYTEKFALEILMNGLGQALARIVSSSKNKDAEVYKYLYEDIEDWLTGDRPTAPYRGANDLLMALTEGTREQYRLATAEALAWLAWHKQLTSTYLKEREEDRG
ncbi:type III-B CRISPR module-associated protein Cmr5 [Thermoflavimicrobium dichotomicum]|uniref:CRISPR type III-B/RAMP module-associated protein Cmr5 n=1 Tax=Thermoflavimicrobium dichotomicum TaxID=46223 RepID=A0A1I3T948_9BACL|nr:type III-B CRISPR module-associated protein Cmr5 [Thermoflavimicrobium dichotomicum]SFJ66291.1 CRISPR-associated protein Cmr5 [Thermoflavimicrobium dichotomicum]